MKAWIPRTHAAAFAWLLSLAGVLTAGSPTAGNGAPSQAVKDPGLLLPPAARGVLVTEAESLLGHAKASGGDVTVQPMAGFGPGWGGDAQLLWRPPAPVNEPIKNWPHLTFYIGAPKSGVYRVALVHTSAPDYGDAHLFVRGVSRGEIQGFASTVQSRRIDLGELKLDQGTNQFVVTVFNKSAASKGFLIGLDRVEIVAQ
jgi:hypothetical protein